MNIGDLERLAAAGESETLELKRSTGERRMGVRAVCAMLNHRGGRVLFGVDPDGRVLGQKVSDRTIEHLVTELGEIDPPAFPNIDRITTSGGLEVVMVTVPMVQHQPYSHRGKAWRRVGNTNQPMSRDEYNRVLLERLHGQHRWENEPAPDWTVDDLDVNEIVRTLDEAIRRGRADDPGTRDPGALLRGFNLTRGGALLRAAVVLFGRPERLEGEYPQCLLRVAKFRGTDRTEFLDNRQFHGNAFELLGRAERFFRENLPVAGRIEPGVFERVDDPLYPPLALREALANAICHRDYSIGGGSVAAAIYDDRLEVSSSGTLHFGLTAEALFAPHESLPWNPLIAQVFYRRGIIEQWGRGTIKMAELATSAGLSEPEIEDAGGGITVRFRSKTYVPPRSVERGVTERQRSILTLLSDTPDGLALREIVPSLAGSATERQIRDDLGTLRVLGLAICEGRGRGARWKHP